MGKRRQFNSKEDLTQKISKSIFVMNFSDLLSARDLWNVCATYGRVIDVYIPFKKSKACKKYAFVRFLKVDNLDRLPKKESDGVIKKSFASVLNSNMQVNSTPHLSSSAIVLDDSCISEIDLSVSLMGKVKDINVLENLHLTFANEGFKTVKLFYLGGLQVLIDASSLALKEKLSKHVGMDSWFQELIPASNSFVNDDGIVWVSVEGLPIKALTRNTFVKILSPWGDFIDVEAPANTSLSYKKICSDNDLEIDHVSETSYMNENDLVTDNHVPESGMNKKCSEDPFGIYKLLNSKKPNEASKGKDPLFPLGFTLIEVENLAAEINVGTSEVTPSKPSSSNGGISRSKSDISYVLKYKPGGSILDLMENLIEVGQTMGFNMEGCMKFFEEIVGFQGEQNVETKMESIDLITIKELWGNSCFDYALCLAVGFSGGILSDLSDRKALWDYICHLVDSWSGESIILEDFNKVQSENERFGSIFNENGANAFNHFITRAGLIDLPLEGYSFTWTHPPASKMSKLDRFLVSEADLDKTIDHGKGNAEIVNERATLLKDLFDLNAKESLDMAQKAKIRWFVEGDENSKNFHGIINKKRSQLAIRCIFVEGDWVVDPNSVINELFNHFANRFSSSANSRIIINSQFPTCLSLDQIDALERIVSYDKIKRAVWDCRANKSPGPDGFTFEFFRRYWSLIDRDVVVAVSDFFFFSDVQSAFVAGRQILDGPFILNELISWCKHHKTKVMIFKVDFEKAFDSVRWDYLDDILNKFGFGLKWRSWIQGCINSAKGCIFVNGSPTSEFKFHKGLKSASLIGCKVLSAPFSYLGVKLKTLSIGGMFTLTKAVLSFIPLYQMSMYRVPMGVLNRLEFTRRYFFNDAEIKRGSSP
ncbi:RNA-directed DNA polymerase, eukaryota [Tanacetum coccineum]